MFLCSQIQDLTLLCFASSDHQRQWLHSQRTNPQHLCSTQPCPTLTWASTGRAGHQRHRELPFPLPPPLRPRLKPEQLPPSSAETLLTSNKLPCTPDPALCPLLGSTSCTQCNTQTVNAAILLKNQYWSRAYLVKNIVTFDQNTELYIAIWLKDIVISF